MNEKINEIESLDKYFPKGDKRRGEALVLVAEAFLLGKEVKCSNFRTKDIKKKLIDAIMYADMDEEDFWATSTISPQQANKLVECWQYIYDMRVMSEKKQKEFSKKFSKKFKEMK